VVAGLGAAGSRPAGGLTPPPPGTGAAVARVGIQGDSARRFPPASDVIPPPYTSSDGSRGVPTMRGLLIATAVAGLAAPASSPPATSQPKPPSWSEPGPPSPSSQTGPWWSGSGQPAPGEGGSGQARGGGWPSQGGDRTSGGGAADDGPGGGSTMGWERAGGAPDQASWGGGQPEAAASRGFYRGSFARPRSDTPAPGAHTYHGSRRGTAHASSPTRSHASHAGGAADRGQGGLAQPMR
jgi:hypothetical protein